MSMTSAPPVIVVGEPTHAGATPSEPSREMGRPRILVADQIAKAGIDLLRGEAHVTVQTGLPPDRLGEVIGEYDALVVRSATKVTRAVLEVGRRLRVIGRAGVGVDNIDVEEATRRGVVVVNSAGAATFSAAEHTLALLLAVARNVPQAMASMQRGEWTPGKFVGVELRGKTLGVVGLGRIGTQVARRALAFGMRVIATDPYISREHAESNEVELVPLDQLVAEADFVSLHAPMNPENADMMGDAEFGRLKPGAFLVNCARGGLVDEGALLRALDGGRLAGAALDVYNDEPPKDSPLVGHPKVV